ncbi:MAG: hypothetical protein P8N25_00255 [Alphaproteobacteria bacterium]|nr:hypothetical protein [Alphaproteobacteria bacterium]
MTNEFECNYTLEKTPAYQEARKRVAKAYDTLAEIHNLEKDAYTNEYTETLDFQIVLQEEKDKICDELGICPVEFEHNSIY